ncbi:MAG: TetR/AcrR family transcriptional regulator [Pseudomonadota bacterium]
MKPTADPEETIAETDTIAAAEAPSDVCDGAGGASTSPGTSRAVRRRAAMIEAATEVFTRHGFAAASLDMVIERSGGSRRTLYEQFGNKEGLFHATIDSMLERVVGAFAVLDGPGSGDPEEDLRAAGTEFLRALLSEDGVAVCRLVMAEMQRFPTLGKRFFDTGPARSYAAVGRYLEQQNAAGRLHVPDPAMSACQLVEMFRGDLHLRALLRGDPTPPCEVIERHVSNAITLFLAGVRG